MKTGLKFRGVYLLVGVVLLMVAVSCSVAEDSVQTPRLAFEAPMNVGSDEVLHVSLGVRNAGSRTFDGDEQFDGRMELRHISGDLRADAEIATLAALEPGEMAWSMSWEGELEPGAYRLTWGSDSYGFTTVDFTLVERDGRLYLLDAAPPEPSVEASEAVDVLVAQAIADLQTRLGVAEGVVTVQQVEETEFPDASLGVPEPGQAYAQVVTPGYVIRLEAAGQVYTYHAAGERIVLASPETGRDTPGEPSYQQVLVPEIGLAFDAPADWRRLEPEMAWTPEMGSEVRLGFDWMELEPPMELEAAMLPSPAQIVDSRPVDLGWVEGRRFTLDVYAPEESFQMHVLCTLNRGGKRLGLDFYAVALSPEALQELEPLLQHVLDTAQLTGDLAPHPTPRPTPYPVPSEAPDVADWPVFRDEAYGFQFKYPPDWTYQEMAAKGSGVPDDWPLARMVIFFPQRWGERFERSGPPDPDAPPAIPAINLEVYLGSEAQYRRVYVEPDVSEQVDVNGTPAIREEEIISEQMRLLRYVFQPVDNDRLRVVLTDNYSGFTERASENEEVVTRIQQIVATFEFVE